MFLNVRAGPTSLRHAVYKIMIRKENLILLNKNILFILKKNNNSFHKLYIKFIEVINNYLLLTS